MNTVAEYLSFPPIFCGKTRPTNDERLIQVPTSEIFKWELHSADTRVALHMKTLTGETYDGEGVLGHAKKQDSRKKITVGHLLNAEEQNNIMKLDEGYTIFKTI